MNPSAPDLNDRLPTTADQATPPPAVHPLVIAFTGLICLAVAMGIGRFAFTPLLPMMLHDGVIDLPQASWLATANYIGYWLGAMACALQPWIWRRLGRVTPLEPTRAVKLGLTATVLLTLGMAVHWPVLWPLWRLLAGIASALVFVFVSGWCLARLTALGRPALGGVIYVGPGAGITLSGLAATAMVASGWSAAWGWLSFGLLAVLLTAVVWPRLRGAGPAAPATGGGAEEGADMARLAPFVLAYGLAGFGYIITATFLPVIARQALPGGSVWLDLFWPIFGLGVAGGALTTLTLPPAWDRRHLLAGAYAIQALGVIFTVAWPSLAGFALGSLLLGLPFTAITLFAMQEARRLRPRGPSALIGLLTASYGLGQIAGPPLAAALLQASPTPAVGFDRSLSVAAVALLLGGATYLWLARIERDR